MRVGLVVPGFSADAQDWCIPALRHLARALAVRDDVRVVAIRYPYRAARYQIEGSEVIAVGGADRRGVAALGVWRRTLEVLRDEHRRRAFDVLHAFWATESGLLTAVAGKLLGIPTVVSLAGGELIALADIGYGDQRVAWERLKVRASLGLASVVTAGSDYLLAVAAAHVRHPQARLHRAPLGVDLDLFNADLAERRAAVHAAAHARDQSPEHAAMHGSARGRDNALEQAAVDASANAWDDASEHAALRAPVHAQDHTPETGAVHIHASDYAAERSAVHASDNASGLASDCACDLASDGASGLASDCASDLAPDCASGPASDSAPALAVDCASGAASDFASAHSRERTSDLAAEHAAARPDGPPRVVHVATLTPIKDQATLLRAFAILRRRLADATLDVVGDGPLRRDLERLACDLSVAEAVRFLGNVDHAALPQVYRGGSAFVLSSRHEAQCMAAIEAAACGVPVVGTCVGVIPELATSSDAVVPVGAVEALADALFATCTSLDAQGRARAAEPRVRAEFGMEASAARFRSLYAQVTSA